MTRPGATRTRLPFRHDIEGLRGLAVLLVVLYHAGVPGFGGGFIGVDVFFVLSGYLITRILTREIEETGELRLGRFYARRIRRLLPAAATVILFTLVVGAALRPPHVQGELTGTAGAAGAYVSNLWLAHATGDYFAGAAERDPLLHMWSLSVEEQFYLVWPVLLLLGLRGASTTRRLAALMGAVVLVSFAGSWWYSTVSRPVAFYLSPWRAWEFAAGGILSLLPTVTRARAPAVRVVEVLGLGLVLGSALLLTAADPFPGSAAVPVVAGTMMLLWAGHTDAAPETAALGSATLQRLGTLSYSWYLWHWPVLVFFLVLAPDAGWLVKTAVACAALVPAALAYRHIEDPLRHHRWLAGRNRRSLAFGAVVTAGVVLLSAGAHVLSDRLARSPRYRAISRAAAMGPLEAAGCVAPYHQETAEGCVYGEATGPVTVLIGDSHAAHWAPGLIPAVEKRGGRLVVFTKGSCPAAAFPVTARTVPGRFGECERWRADAARKIAELQPDLVMVGNSQAYPSDNIYLGDGEPYRAWRAGLRSFVARVSAVAGRVVLLQDTPQMRRSVPECLTTGPVLRARGSCARARADAIDPRVADANRAVAAELDNVRVADLTDRFCRDGICPAVVDGVIAYRDGHHVSTAMATALEAPLGRILDRALGDPSRGGTGGPAAGGTVAAEAAP